MEPVLKLAPPHLTLGSATSRTPSRMHTTCVAFGNRGDKVRCPVLEGEKEASKAVSATCHKQAAS